MKKIQYHLDKAYEAAEQEIERLARKILLAHPNLDEFVCAMGSVGFTLKNKEGELNLDERAYFKPLYDLFVKFDDSLGLSGIPMRFTATGPTITDW